MSDDAKLIKELKERVEWLEALLGANTAVTPNGTITHINWGDHFPFEITPEEDNE